MRVRIEELLSAESTIELPLFDDPTKLSKPEQLKFLFFEGDPEEEEELEESTEGDSSEMDEN